MHPLHALQRVYTYVHMETLVLDGKEFVKASKAAKDLGYTADHVGQLCRSGKVTAHLVGRTWYVRKEELSEHKVEKKRILRAKAREYAKKSIEEHRKKSAERTVRVEKKPVLRYENDDRELIPQVRKISVTAIPVAEKLRMPAPEEAETTLENEGEKILMSGTLKVTDVTDGEEDVETVHLKPKILKSHPPKIVPSISESPVPEDSQAESIPVHSFAEKLAAANVHLTEGAEAPAPSQEAVPSENMDVPETIQETHVSIVGQLLTILVVCILVLLSSIAITTLSYTSDEPTRMESEISLPIRSLLEIYGLKY